VAPWASISRAGWGGGGVVRRSPHYGLLNASGGRVGLDDVASDDAEKLEADPAACHWVERAAQMMGEGIHARESTGGEAGRARRVRSPINQPVG